MNWSNFISVFVVAVYFLIGYYICERKYKKKLQRADKIYKLNLKTIQNRQDQIAEYQIIIDKQFEQLNQLKDFVVIVLDELDRNDCITRKGFTYNIANIDIEDIHKLIS